MALVGYLTLALVARSLTWLPASLAQPLPAGSEFQVNSYTTSQQYRPSVAADAMGNFVVVWDSYGSAESDISDSSIQAQRFDPTGTPIGPQFQVNSYTTDLQYGPAVATDATGNFVVTWYSRGSVGTDVDGSSIQAQRYDSAGVPVGGQFQVNSYTTSGQVWPRVAFDGTGRFVVVWYSYGSVGSDTSGASVQGRRFDATGTPIGGQFQVNSYTTAFQFEPEVAADPAGNFVVVWESNGSAGTDTDFFSVQGQRYDSSGTPVDGEFQVNTYTTLGQRNASVAMDAGGNFLVTWSSFGSPTLPGTFSPHAQRYDSNGVPVGGELQLNSYTTGDHGRTAVAAQADGSFLVAWSSNASSPGPDTDELSVQARFIDTTGTPLDSQFQVNSYATSRQGPKIGVAADGSGNFVVVWHSAGSAGSDSDDFSVQGQRFVSPDRLLPGRVVVVKPGALARFVARPMAGDSFALPSQNAVAVGGSLRIFDAASSAGDDTYSLPAGAAWTGLGSPAGSKGYRFRTAATSSDPCKVVLIKETVIKAVCKGSSVTLTPPFAADVAVVLTVGASERYCARFGGDEIRNDTTLTKRKNAPAPGACP